jgi:cyclophilin family peptidyl-prolyl cis-trans isomerase
MRKIGTLFLFFMVTGMAVVQAQSTFVRLLTSKGDVVLKLYDATPKHRDMFVKVIREGLYNDAQFNRVIKAFVSQGGELDDTILEREAQHPELPLKRIDAEIKAGLFHKKGALGAGRNDNPEKSSYLTQIYLVQGKVQTEAQLDALEQKKGMKFSAEQREAYKTIGGCPNLDGDYTIFGEIVAGLEVAEAINLVPTSKQDLPVVPVHFKAEILKAKQIKRYISSGSAHH